MKRVSFDGMSCSIARSLEVVGEWWTPLIVREISFGRRRFDEIQAGLGISRNILTDRLNGLVDDGVLARHNIAQQGTRHEYRLTEKGRALMPVLIALMQWGDEWMADEKGPPVELEHRSCGHRTHPRYACSHCGDELTPGSVKAHRAPAWQDDDAHPVPAGPPIAGADAASDAPVIASR